MTAASSTPDARQLRKFGFIMAGMIALFFGALFPWLKHFTPPLWVWGLAGAFALAGLLIPRGLGPIYVVWMKLGSVLGWINSRIILGIVFYAIILPIGMIIRLGGKDPMARKPDQGATSYRKVSRRSPREQLERPF